MTEHHFNVEVAKVVGVTAAAVLHNFVFWCEKNAADERNHRDGRVWAYASIKSLTRLFPYLSDKQIRTAIDKLVGAGLLVKGDFNLDKFDRTVWYAVTDACSPFYHLGKWGDFPARSANGPSCPKGQMVGVAQKGKCFIGKYSEQLLLDNTDIDNESKKNIDIQPQLFNTENPNKKTLFKNSGIGERSKFMERFAGPEYAPFDLDDYFNAINNWSNQKNVKRTLAGWVSTLDAWIRRDLKSGRAVYRPEYDPNKQTREAQTDYLNDFRG